MQRCMSGVCYFVLRYAGVLGVVAGCASTKEAVKFVSWPCLWGIAGWSSVVAIPSA